MTATATSTWNAKTRGKAASKGQALPDGSYPIKDKTDWHKAKQALGRAKNRRAVVAHLKRRARALGIPKEEYQNLRASLVASLREQVHQGPLTAATSAAQRQQESQARQQRAWDESQVTRDMDPGEEGRFAPRGSKSNKKTEGRGGRGGRGAGNSRRASSAEVRAQKELRAELRRKINKIKTPEDREALYAELRERYGDDFETFEDGGGRMMIGNQRITFPADDDFDENGRWKPEEKRRLMAGNRENAAGGSSGGSGSGGGGGGGGGEHAIKSGDTLSAIAKAALGDANRWEEIYELNKAEIDAEARRRGKPGGGHWIFPGLKLKMPAR